MNTFEKARLKLTLWYVVISVIISTLFSVAIFNITEHDIVNGYRRSLMRFERDFRSNIIFYQEIEDAENQLKLNLLRINILILGLSTIAGYILAGRSLKPIKIMVEEQKRFVSDSSHELRTPLTALKSTIEVALRDKDLSVVSAKDVLKSNLEEVNHMQALSDNLLLLTHYENKLDISNFEPIPLREVLTKSVQKLSNLAKEKEIKVNLSVGEEKVIGDEEMLIQLFVIFIDNAIKYSPSKTTVSIKSLKKQNFVMVIISDHGIGIDNRDLPYIFDRFFRSDKSRTKNETNGYGLGLSIAKKILGMLHGSVSVESKVKKGSTFIITLPIE